MSLPIDLRSDTVTRPSPEMRQAMAAAEVGDAVYNEDPTVNLLEQRVAELLGKEAALFVVSGTMANLLAIRLHADAGDEVIAESSAHPVLYEAGGSAAFTGVLFKTVPGRAGILAPEEVAAAIYEPAYYRPVQRALLVENTHNRGGGTIYPVPVLEQLKAVAHGHGLKVHMDGARLWNAVVGSGVAPARLAACADTVSVCFSKGLGAPVGSALAGSREEIERARHYRHMVGGSWRQAGVLAAAALYALEHNLERLREDHEKARLLARRLSEQGFPVVNEVQTNMVYFRAEGCERLLARLEESGVLMSQIGPGAIRAVTHLDVSLEDIEAAAAAVGRCR